MNTFRQVRENFADGRNPQDQGDSARHGIPSKASIAQLEKIRSSDSASPRKKQLAHWQINMRRGRAKANESTQFAVQGHQVHADSSGMKIYHGGELVHHITGDFSNPTKMDRARVQRYVTNKIESSPEYKAKRDSLLNKEDYENPYRFDWGTPAGTAYMKRMTPKMQIEPMYKNTKVSLPATKKIIKP